MAIISRFPRTKRKRHPIQQLARASFTLRDGSASVLLIADAVQQSLTVVTTIRQETQYTVFQRVFTCKASRPPSPELAQTYYAALTDWLDTNAVLGTPTERILCELEQNLTRIQLPS